MGPTLTLTPTLALSLNPNPNPNPNSNPNPDPHPNPNLTLTLTLTLPGGPLAVQNRPPTRMHWWWSHAIPVIGYPTEVQLLRLEPSPRPSPFTPHLSSLSPHSLPLTPYPHPKPTLALALALTLTLSRTLT